MSEIIYPNLSYSIQGAFFEVNDALRHLDLSEKGWETALQIALEERGICADRQVEHQLHYKGYRVGLFFVDMIAADTILLELKVKDQLEPIDFAQVIAYLKVTGLRLGILVRFGGNKVDFVRILNRIRGRKPGTVWDSTVASLEGLLYPELTGELRTAFREVHHELGPDYVHMHYRRAAQIELDKRGIYYEVKKEVVIRFRGRPIETRETRLIIVEDKVLVAVMAVLRITPKLKGRIRQYLKLLDLTLGMIVNFHSPDIEIETVRILQRT